MNKIFPHVIVIISLIFTLGCSATSSLPQPTAPLPQLVNSVRGTELATVISDECLITDSRSGIVTPSELAPLAAALLAAVVPKAIDKGLDYVSARLKAAAAAQTTSMEARTTDYLYSIESIPVTSPGEPAASKFLFNVRPNTDARCLHVVAFTDGSTTDATNGWNSITTLVEKAQRQRVELNFLKQNPQVLDFVADGVPIFLAEFRLWRYPADKAFLLVPTFVTYLKPVSGAEPDGKARTLTLTIVLSSTDRKVFYTDTVNLGSWTPGVAFGPEVATRFTPALGQIPSPPEQAIHLAASFSAMTTEKLEQNSNLLSDNRQVLPFTAEVTLVETTEGKKWLATLADVLAESKEEVGAALTEQILPQKKAAAELEEQKAELSLLQTFELALIDVRVACEAWESADGATKLAKWKALVDARFKANSAAISAGEAIRFPDPLLESC